MKTFREYLAEAKVEKEIDLNESINIKSVFEKTLSKIDEYNIKIEGDTISVHSQKADNKKFTSPELIDAFKNNKIINEYFDISYKFENDDESGPGYTTYRRYEHVYMKFKLNNIIKLLELDKIKSKS